MLSDSYAVIAVKVSDGKPDEYIWVGNSNIVGIAPELVSLGFIEKLPWKLEFVRDEEVPGTSKDGKGLVLRKLYRRLDTL